MSPEDHYDEAERLLKLRAELFAKIEKKIGPAGTLTDPQVVDWIERASQAALQEAQVHATLATVRHDKLPSFEELAHLVERGRRSYE